ncbi:hypothetical protein DFJ77DRAFT_323389 [Powellomyces hirtus]|nr:hypothetical protein DFJ77DRAFT_323389 [Powellomyces hirtus]
MTRSIILASALAAASSLLLVTAAPVPAYEASRPHKGYFAGARYSGATNEHHNNNNNNHKQPTEHQWPTHDGAEWNEAHYDVYKAIMCGEKEVPGKIVGENAFGNALLVLRKSDKTAAFAASHFNTGPITKLHIHGPADQHNNASVVFNVLPTTDPAFTTTANPLRNEQPLVFDEEKLKMLAQGLMYVNVHSSKHKDGALRGQLLCASKHCEAPGHVKVARFVDDGICNNAIFGHQKGRGGNRPHDEDKKTHHWQQEHDNQYEEKDEYPEHENKHDTSKKHGVAASAPANYYDQGDVEDDNNYNHHQAEKYEDDYEEPTYEDDHEEPTYEDDYEEPSYEEPTYEEPTYEEPNYEEPTYEAAPYKALTSEHHNNKAPDCSAAKHHFKSTGSPTLIQCAEIACEPSQSHKYINRALFQCHAMEKAARRNNHGKIPHGC